jgi:hypothetical protein
MAAACIALGLWISGSRTALFACPVALACLGAAGARRHTTTRERIAAMLVAIVLLGAAVAAIYAPARGNQRASSVAAQVRVEMARTTVRMVSEAPVFGIGLGEFSRRAGEFISPRLLELFPVARHENAHNNFFQILAETGLSGVAVFLWLLVASLYAAARPLSIVPRDALAWSVMAGLAAYLLTCLGGHPLLTREAAYAFWMVLGIGVGHGSRSAAPKPAAAAASIEWQHRVAVVVLAAIIVSIPPRMISAKAQADFEHLGIGLSPQWETAEDGVKYRSAVSRASVFVPSDTAFRFRVRSLSKNPERLELTLAGRLADVVLLAPDRWTDVAVPARSSRPDTRFAQMDLRILDADQRPVTLWITKVEQLAR